MDRFLPIIHSDNNLYKKDGCTRLRQCSTKVMTRLLAMYNVVTRLIAIYKVVTTLYSNVAHDLVKNG